MKKEIIVLLAVALAGCKQPDNDTLNAVDNEIATEGSNANAEPLAPSGAGDAPTSNNAVSSASGIPASFHGRWGLVAADCTSTRGDAKGLLTIDGARLVFYEARGTVGQILGTTASSFDARYDFTGEGQTWKRTERLSFVEGKLQRRTDAEPGQEPPVNLTYQRCAA